ncbi:MAG: VanW family protein [Candidatus Pacebacteria bacterium GW2011_GWA1_46_10]|nr:MAG: VanW family protein [Candidatus Pacebacteria bacterium GW2011_GWA1_46_10]
MVIMEGFFTPSKGVFFGIHFADVHFDESTEVDIVNLNSPTPKQIVRIVGVILSLILLTTFTGFVVDARRQFLPGTTLERVAIGSLTPAEALTKVRHVDLQPINHTIELTALDQTVASSSAQLEASYHYDQTLTAILQSQQADFFGWLRQLLSNNQAELAYPLPVTYNQDKLKLLIQALKAQVDAPPHFPSAKLNTSGLTESLVIDTGEDIFTLNESATLQQLTEKLSQVTNQTLAQNSDQPISAAAVLDPVSQQLTPEQITQAHERAGRLVGEKLVFEKDHLKRTLNDTQLVSLLTFPDGYQTEAINEVLYQWAQEINRVPQNAEFVYDPETLVVSVFVPDRKGLELNTAMMAQSVVDGLKELEGTDTQNLNDATLTKELALIETEAEKTLAETNNLGIKERIGFGESYYYHSIPSRVHNVSLTTNRISLTLVAPGEEFSFNKTLGEVSAATGFQPAYVIMSGRTVLGDGGGVCQVSSTLFRALLDSGLNITRRLQHSYRVSYYELDRQPGFDATVYAGNVDLRFINDTDDYVLVYGQADPDGRTTEIKDYQSWDPRPPLPTQYIPDSTLAPGQLKQVDWSAAGIKAKFTHIVRDKDGKIMRENEYYSNYRPWAAKFLQGV